jgi:hypothetical protein
MRRMSRDCPARRRARRRYVVYTTVPPVWPKTPPKKGGSAQKFNIGAANVRFGYYVGSGEMRFQRQAAEPAYSQEGPRTPH